MSPEQLSPEKRVFYETTKKTAQNVSQLLLAQEGKTIIIKDHEGKEIQLKKRAMSRLMFGLLIDIQELGFSIEEVKTILNPPAKPVALGLKKG